MFLLFQLNDSPSILLHKRPRLKTKADRIKLSHHMKVLRANGMDGKNELPHLVRVLPLVMLQTVFGFLF